MTPDILPNLTLMREDQSLFNSGAGTLVNTVNCVGVMGKGIAKEFKVRYPEMFGDYQKRCERREVNIGEPYLWKDDGKKWVLNFPTKINYRNPSKVEWIEAGLDHFCRHYGEWGIRSIAFPALGCSNGGLEWDAVYPLMMRYLGELEDMQIEVYPPRRIER